jgi:DNA-binding beta-propeller fold protein YncE
MPPLALALLLHPALPRLSALGRAVINTLICDNGRVGSADALAERLGLRSRFQLNRLLHREGLPPYEELAGWVCVFHWMQRADACGETLRSLAREARMDPASCYRLVRRVTGLRWSALRRAGTERIKSSFLKRCGGSTAASPMEEVSIRSRALRRRHDQEMAARAEFARLVPRRISLPGGGHPHGIAIRGNTAYVTRTHAASLDCLDLTSGQVTSSIAVGCAPTCIALNAAGDRAYVSVQHCDEIAVIDTVNHVRLHALPLPGDPFPLLLTPRGNVLYVTTNEDRLYALCPQNGRILASLRLPATSHHLALHPAGNRLYVATRAGGSVLEVDTARHEVVREFKIGGWPQGLALSADGTKLYVANEKHGVDLICLGTGHRVAMLQEHGGALEVALSSDSRVLYVGFVHSGKVGVIDSASLKLLGTLDTGGRPRGIAVDHADGLTVVNEGGWVDVFPRGTAQPALTMALEYPALASAAGS